MAETHKAVLAIGIDPRYADLSMMPGATPELLRAYIDQQVGRLRDFGWDAESCLIDPGNAAEEQVRTALTARAYDCVVIGAGLREPADLLVLFEKVLNLVHCLAPQARIAFNSTPADTAEAARRWLVD